MPEGSLYFVGTGLRLGQATMEAVEHIKKADKVLHIVAEQDTINWLKSLHPNVETLARYYAKGKPRRESYDQMVDRILYFVRDGFRVCVVFYGHPGVFVDPSHRALKIAREEGYHAEMLPGVSAEDCLFAELGVDPANDGCQSFEATRFLKAKYSFDVRSNLVLWQVGVIGFRAFRFPYVETRGVPVLVDYLLPFYGPDHVVTLYEAAMFVGETAKITRVPLGELNGSHVTPMATLLVPPKGAAVADEEMSSKLQFA
jgi:uncharacterized protein YabN with tetrapyrrole methylase and pyrophosphatase domain